MATANPFGTNTAYSYDAFGNRLKVKSGTTPFAVQIYDLWGHLLTETSSAAPPVETDYVYLDDMPLSVIKPSTPTVSYIHTDRIGTPQVATSATKTTVWICNYQPFGSCTPTASVTMNDRLPGMYNDFTVMNHNGFRDFHIGGDSIYLEADPLDLRLQPFSNGYNYANQNPTKYIDTLGLYAALQVTLPNGVPTFAITTIKNSAQAQAYKDAEVNGPITVGSTTVPIAVPSGADPQALVKEWSAARALTTIAPTLTYANFAAFWIPGGPHDYKNAPPRSLYDAFGNFEYGATGTAAGLTCSVLQGAGEGLSLAKYGELNDPINATDIQSGIDAVSQGGTLSVNDYSP
jgi:RHS repeat-associated protein